MKNPQERHTSYREKRNFTSGECTVTRLGKSDDFSSKNINKTVYY